MIVNVSRAMKDPGHRYPFAGEVTLPPMDVLDDEIEFANISVAGDFSGAVESVCVKATVRATVRAHCARCLSSVAQNVETSIDEIFTKTPDPDDPDQHPLDGYEVALDDLIKDALLLAIPMRFLCKPDCAGLCPSCGINRNNQRCTCQEGGERTNPFSALSVLLTEE